MTQQKEKKAPAESGRVRSSDRTADKTKVTDEQQEVSWQPESGAVPRRNPVSDIGQIPDRSPKQERL